MSVDTVKHWAQKPRSQRSARDDTAASICCRQAAQCRVTVCAKFLKSDGTHSNSCSFSCWKIFHCVRHRCAQARGQGDCRAGRFFERTHYYSAEGVARGGEACAKRPCGEEIGDSFDERC